MNNIIVLGAGMVGSAMAIDLAHRYKVTLTDKSDAVLQRIDTHANLRTQCLDVTDKRALQEALAAFDIVLCAVPGFLGFNTLKAIIEAGKDVVDISFFPENALELDELAKQHGVTAIVDCGVAPGMGNFILGYHNEKIELTEFECLVGGLPKKKQWPFNYKAPFSPMDVIEEYTRPARYVENGQLVVREALTDCELVDFGKIGTLESFNSDGLRSIIHTMSHIPNMKEKTLRYPGHVEYIKVLKTAGFFNTEPVNVDGDTVVPLNFTSKMLFDAWKLEPEEEEFTIMRIKLVGKDTESKKVTIQYDLFDEYDAKTKTSSMARTTGYTATAAVNLLLDGHFPKKGLFPPELVGVDENCFQFILQYLEERNVVYTKSVVKGE